MGFFDWLSDMDADFVYDIKRLLTEHQMSAHEAADCLMADACIPADVNEYEWRMLLKAFILGIQCQSK